MIYYKCDHQGEYYGHCTPIYIYIYKNLRIAKILVFMILKDSIVAHRSIKIHKLPKIYVR
jgi:hypothetical protein